MDAATRYDMDAATRCDLPGLNPRHRAAIHAAADAAGIGHASAGEGTGRTLSIGCLDPTARVVTVKADKTDDDAALVAALEAAVGAEFAGAVKTALATKPPPPPSATRPTTTQPIAVNTSDATSYAASILPLLTAERDAEVAAARAALAAGGRGGHRLGPLRIDDVTTGLMGRTVIQFVSAKGGGGTGKKATTPSDRTPLPAHRFGPHDLCELRPAKAAPSDPPLASGVVSRLTDATVAVAFDDAPDVETDSAASFRLDRLANDVTHRRLTGAVDDLVAVARTGSGPGAGVVGVLFGGAAAPSAPLAAPLTPFNAGLDASQRAAVEAALGATRLALVHGPPGTGKTTTVVEIVRQLVAQGNRVLLAAPSNVAVDTLVERVAAADPRLPIVRLGHPARLLPSVLSTCLDARVAASDAAGLAADARADAKKLTAKLAKLGRRDGDARRRIRGELRALAKEARVRDAKAVAEVVSRARVVAATLTGLSPRVLGGVTRQAQDDGSAPPPLFDVAVVDEAAQALEPAAWAALLRAPKAVLAGDHKQLPPTVTCEAAARDGLAVTLFERAHAMLDRAAEADAKKGDGSAAASDHHPCIAMLTTQYRMNDAIGGWASGEMYGGRLTAHESVAQHTLADLLRSRGDAAAADAAADDDALGPLLLIDTAGCDCDEVEPEGGDGSTANPREAAAAWAHVRRLLAAGLTDADIGVIAPYSAQVAALRGLRPAEGPGSAVEISTVDAFQGREKEAIVISATRSNPDRVVGFLADARRMNVAVTRGRRHVALVCDSDTLAGDAFLGRLVAWVSEHGCHETADGLVD